METVQFRRKGYTFRLVFSLLSLTITVILIVLIILSKGQLIAQKTLYYLLGYIVIYSIVLVLINMSIKKFVLKTIKKNLNVINETHFFYLKQTMTLRDSIFINSETKLLCLIDSYKKSKVNLHVFSKNEIQTIHEKFERPEDKYNNAKAEYEYELNNAAKNYNKYTVAGGLIGGIGGAVTGAVIDGLRSKVPDDPDENSDFNFSVGLFIRLTNGYSKQLVFSSSVKKEYINHHLEPVREIITKIRSL